MKKLTQQHLRRHPEKLHRFDKVRIWSGEWRAWWRPDGGGYTDDRLQAGIYDAEDAWRRVRHCGPEKKISLHAVDPVKDDDAPAWTTPAARDVLAERQRQIKVEGFDPERDDQYTDESLSAAAACYAIGDLGFKNFTRRWVGGKVIMVPPLWPESWHPAWWKPKSRRADLVKAGALILAEIERLDRAEAGGGAST